MYCSKCGNKMVDGDKFCTACGKEAQSIPKKEDYSEYARPKMQNDKLPVNENSVDDFSAPLIGDGFAELYAENLSDLNDLNDMNDFSESSDTCENGEDSKASAEKSSGHGHGYGKKRAARSIIGIAAAVVFAAGCSAVTYRYAWNAGAESMTITSSELNRANENASDIRDFVQSYIGDNSNGTKRRTEVQQEILGEYDCEEYGSSDFALQLRKELQKDGISSGTIIISTAYIGGMDTLFVQWQEAGDKNDVKAVGQYPDPISFESRYAVVFGQYKETEA